MVISFGSPHNSTEIMNVFVGYGGRRAEQFARRLARRLRREHFHVFIATPGSRSMIAGLNLNRRISRAIADADVVVMVCTRATVNSLPAKGEIRLAQEIDTVVVPFVEEGSPVPPALRRPKSGERLNTRTALLGLFVALTIAFASTTVYESGIRTTLTSTSTSTSTSTVTAISVSTITTTSVVDPTRALEDAYLSHIGAIESRNATALAAQYETNATSLGAVPGGVNDSFDGIANCRVAALLSG